MFWFCKKSKRFSMAHKFSLPNSFTARTKTQWWKPHKTHHKWIGITSFQSKIAARTIWTPITFSKFMRCILHHLSITNSKWINNELEVKIHRVNKLCDNKDTAQPYLCQMSEYRFVAAPYLLFSHRTVYWPVFLNSQCSQSKRWIRGTQCQQSNAIWSYW